LFIYPETDRESLMGSPTGSDPITLTYAKVRAASNQRHRPALGLSREFLSRFPRMRRFGYSSGFWLSVVVGDARRFRWWRVSLKPSLSL